MSVPTLPEPWLRGPVDGVAPVLQPAAHALLQAQEDIAAHARELPAEVLWQATGAATAGFHALHLAGALDSLYTYARGEALSESQRAALKAESMPHPELDGPALIRIVDDAVGRALDQLRDTPAERILDERRVGRAGLPSTVLGLLAHGAEHSTRHSGQFITTVRLLAARR